MAEWDISTQYSPGNIVTYNGLTYLRSIYPSSPTSGENPYDQMSVDPLDEPIRSWELIAPSLNKVPVPFNIGYFSLLAAERSDGVYTNDPPCDPPVYPGKLLPQHPYAGHLGPIYDAYSYFSESLGSLGSSVLWDQERDAVEADPGPPPVSEVVSAPAMPATSCGVCLQQFQETSEPLNISYAYAGTAATYKVNLTYNAETESWYEDFYARPRIYYIFLLFNHPLFFRRQHTITIRTSTYEYAEGYYIPGDPPIFVPGTHTGTYSSEDITRLPTDVNYVTGNLSSDYYIPVNAIATYQLENDSEEDGPYGSKTGTNYDVVEIFVKSVEPNFI